MKSGGNGAGTGFWGMALGLDWSVRMGKTLENANEIRLKRLRNTLEKWATGFWGMALGVDWSVSRRGRSFSCLRRPETPSARVTCRAVAKKPQNSWMLENQVANNSNWGESESGARI